MSTRILIIDCNPLTLTWQVELAGRLLESGFDVYGSASALETVTGHPAVTDIANWPSDSPVILYGADERALHRIHFGQEAPVLAVPLYMEKTPPNTCLPVVLPPPGETHFWGKAGRICLATPLQVYETLLFLLTPGDFQGKTILVTAGPTIEDIDPARFVSNRSSGKMGVAIARMAARRGANVLLLHGPMQATVPPVPGIQDVPVRSAQELHRAVMERVEHCDLAILCAAVADFQPIEYAEEKIKKGKSDTFTLKMRKTPDILASIGALPNGVRPFLVGFAAESTNVEDNAAAKLTAKNCDLLCANDITAPGCGFEVNTNALTILGRDGYRKLLPTAPKDDIANALLDVIAERMSEGFP